MDVPAFRDMILERPKARKRKNKPFVPPPRPMDYPAPVLVIESVPPPLALGSDLGRMIPVVPVQKIASPNLFLKTQEGLFGRHSRTITAGLFHDYLEIDGGRIYARNLFFRYARSGCVDIGPTDLKMAAARTNTATFDKLLLYLLTRATESGADSINPAGVVSVCIDPKIR